jgi:hypothetical protein
MAKVWMPVEDGLYDAQHFNHNIIVEGEWLKVFEPDMYGSGSHDEAEVALPDDLRLCRLVDQPAAPAGAGVLTDEVRATITAALDVLRETRLVDLWYLGCDQDIRGEPVDKALAWLAEQEGQAHGG